MTRQPTAQPGKPGRAAPEPMDSEQPITGVASGSLGTAANLDDTQVMRTADLEAAAPAWLEDEVEASPPAASTPVVAAEATPAVAAEATPPAGASATPAAAIEPPAQGVAPVATVVTVPRSRTTAGRAGVRTPVLAGIVAVVVLLVVGGLGFASQFHLDASGNAASAPGFGFATDPPPTATPQPKPPEAGKGPGHCHGHGKHCGGVATED